MKEEGIIISPELARIHAHLCGDGSVFRYKTMEKDRVNRAVIGYYNKNQRLLDNFRRDFNEIFNVKMKMRQGREVYVQSIKLFNLLINNFGSFHSKDWRITDSIKSSSKEIKLEWLKAFFEDEAYREKRYNRLKIKSVNYLGLKDVKGMLRSLGVDSSLTGPNCDNTYYLTISHFDNIHEFR